MPPFSARFGGYNTEGSINAFFTTALTANGMPAWMPSARVLYDLGTEGLILSGYSGHAFTISHMPSEPIVQFQGGAADNGTGGYMRRGAVQVDAWISKTYGGAAFAARVRTMRDMVARAVGSGQSVMLLNAYASTTTPPPMTAIIRVAPPRFDGIAVDFRIPDYIRIRGMCDVTFIERNG